MPEEWNAVSCLSEDWGKLNLTDTEMSSVQCPAIWDGLSCWRPTLAGSTVSSVCPSFRGSDITKSAFRICSISGEWLDRDGIPSPIGWTNYTSCITPEINEIIKRMGSDADAKAKLGIAENTRILEFIGLSLSLGALLLSLLVFYYFRSLRNSRTRIHRHLFIAMVIQVVIRLTMYTDQAITRSFESADGNPILTVDFKNAGDVSKELRTHWGIENTPILCEASYICLEYATTAMFMWMFVEGLFLHNLIAVTVFEEKVPAYVYPIIGWILPIPLTATWATATHLKYGNATCWWGYSSTLYFWILEGPRLAVLVINLAFLLNILRVIVIKLRKFKSSETQQVKKAVKAALVLLPLLGLTNVLSLLNAPLEKSPFQFALWSYTTHVLTSTQGLILAILYCFKNGEVQTAIRKFARIRIFGNSRHFILAKIPSSLVPSLEGVGVFPADVESGGGGSGGSPYENDIQSQHVPSSSDDDKSLSSSNATPSLVVRSYQNGALKRIPIKFDQQRNREGHPYKKSHNSHQLNKHTHQQHHVSQRYFENQRFLRHHSGSCCDNYLGRKIPLFFQQQQQQQSQQQQPSQINRTVPTSSTSNHKREKSIHFLLPICVFERSKELFRFKAN